MICEDVFVIKYLGQTSAIDSWGAGMPIFRFRKEDRKRDTNITRFEKLSTARGQ